MSKNFVSDEIERFMSSKGPGVLCITGAWGTGKTYAWNALLKRGRDKLAYPKYSYVSLFGLNSIAELKQAIFENRVDRAKAGDAPTWETWRDNFRWFAKKGGPWFLKFVQKLPVLKDWIGHIEVGPLYLLVKDTLVCIDDLERKGRGLASADVLGVISDLRERKNCKVVLILNEEALEEDRGSFALHLEKVAETKIRFEPSSEECVAIGLDRSKLRAAPLVKKFCLKLNITNIRVIQKIREATDRLEPCLEGADPATFEGALQTLVLAVWSLAQPKIAPPIDVMRRKAAFQAAPSNNPLAVQSAQWQGFLNDFGFVSCDEMDLVILDGVEKGYFDIATLRQHVDSRIKDAEHRRHQQDFHDVWRFVHDSFDSNEEVVIATIEGVFREHVGFLSPNDLNGTFTVLRALNRLEMARQLLRLYVETHPRGSRFELILADPDPEVVEALSRSAVPPPAKSVSPPLLKADGSFNVEDIEQLANMSVDEYCAMIVGWRGTELERNMRDILQFRGIVNPTEPMRRVVENTEAALRRLGSQTALNALRVRKFGIVIGSANYSEEEDINS